MTTVIVCYSLTGRTRKLCAALARRLGAEMVEIEAPAVRGGVWGMLRWGFAALRGRRTEVRAEVPSLAAGDTLILGAQIWAGRISVPMRSWLEDAPPLPRRVALVLTSGDTRFPEKGFAQFAKLSGREPVARLHVSQAAVDKDAFAPALDEFCASLAE